MNSIFNFRNLLPIAALNYLLRVCHTPEDIEIARTAVRLYQAKTIEISEETVLLYVKACCRVGKR